MLNPFLEDLDMKRPKACQHVSEPVLCTASVLATLRSPHLALDIRPTGQRVHPAKHLLVYMPCTGPPGTRLSLSSSDRLSQ